MIQILLAVFAVLFAQVSAQGPCVDRLPNCQKNLGLCTADGELVFQHHYCRATCGNCAQSSLEAIVPPCPSEYPPVSQQLKKKFTSGQLRLAMELYNLIPIHERVREGSNFVIAPFSIASMLTTLYEGASGSTKHSLEQFSLYRFMNEEEIRHVYSKMQNVFRRQMMQPLPKATELYQANVFFFGEQYKIRQKYRDLATGCYDATLMRKKNGNNPPQAKEEINKAIQGMTFGTVKHRMLDPNDTTVDLSPNHLTLANAAYFKSDFHYAPVVLHKFYPPTSREGVEVPMSYVETYVKYHSVHLPTLRFHVVGVDLIHRAQTLYLLLPYSRYGLTRMERALTPIMLDNSINVAYTDAWNDTLLLPKFEASGTLDLKPYLEKMGLEGVFATPKLEEFFLGHKVPKPIAHLYHRADFRMYDNYVIDESPYIRNRLRFLHEKPNTFLATHPFLFVVKDNDTGAILLMGRVLNPAKKVKIEGE